MKNSIIILSAIIMTLSSFKTFHHKPLGDAAAERMAQSVLAALQHNSIEEYTALYPSLVAFHDIMEKNSAYYGKNLQEAKKDFALQYYQQVVPSLNQSFNAMIAKGKSAGIDWNDIMLTGVALEDSAPNASATISFISNNKAYQIRFEKALFINGEWKVTQFADLI